METTRFITTVLAALTLTALPLASTMAEETIDTTKNVTVRVKGVTVNGKPITPKQKEVAKEMTKKGAQMAAKGTRLALAAVTNPSKADSLGRELEKMGDEMDRLGDSLEALGEDTTFFYEGEDSDAVVITDDDFDDIVEDWTEDGFWKGIFGGGMGLLGGGLGIMGGILGIFVALFVVILLFGIFTAPIWIAALIIWLIVRNTNKNSAQAQQVRQTTSSGQPLHATAQPDGNTATATTAATGSAQNLAQPYPDENAEMWKSGIMYCCIGVGLILLFLSTLEDFWGIGALVACIGVAKLIIATTTKKKHDDAGSDTFYTQAQGTDLSDANGPQQHPAASDDYNKNENR